MNYKRFPLGGLWTNGYLFYDAEGSAFFVDPGGDVREVLEGLIEKKLTLKAVFLTHGHLDHLSGLEGFLPLVGGDVFIAREDAPLLKHPPEEMQRYLNMPCRGTENFKTIADGDVLAVGQFAVKVLATPGHTEGSVCFLVQLGDESVLVSGDTLFAQSVGRTDLPGGDAAKLEESLRTLALLPGSLPVFPGHGPDTTIERERASNPFWPR